ncbi:T9SS type A sorting domain-containing protein, partial [Bacteroidota bacterium]|nr:T9SS type A sorting domain-containing protein [Bacteroidota bacterium]
MENYIFFENDGNIPANFSLSSPNFFQIDIGSFATPFIYDVNKDGLNDLIVGEQIGTINYFPNRGTINSAIFDTIIQNFGNVDIEDSVISTGYSSPKIIDINNKRYLISGSFSGYLYAFEIESIDSSFAPTDIGLNNLWDGSITAIDFTDLNNDYKLDIIIGNKSGGLTYYNSDSLLTNTNNLPNNELMLFPNPTKNNITIVSKILGNVELYNTHGILILQKTKKSDKLRISLKNVSNGIYYLKFNNKTNLV